MNPANQLPFYTVAHTNGPGCDLKASDGATIGFFADYRNAEFLLDSIKELSSGVLKLEGEVNKLEDEISARDEIIDKMRKKVTA